MSVALAFALAAAQPMMIVPVVGCASDGQIGPQPAPRVGAQRLAIPAAAAPRLALYRSAQAEVLAPRGWHCFGLYGSNGQSLIVTPAPIDSNRVFGGHLRGPVVQRSDSFGETSGRFEVATIAARLFPAAKPFVDGVEREGFRDEKLARTPFPRDRLLEHGATRVRAITPAHAEGLGTQSLLAADDRPIDSLVMIFPQYEMNMTSVMVRLLREERDLAAPIIDFMERRER